MSTKITCTTNSRFLNPYYGKLKNTFPNPDSFSFKYRLEQSYFVRNYYHFNYIKSIGGEAYFYTLTYNNKNLPHWFGIPTCDNRDLRWFIQDSGFRQILRYRYGVSLGYFITTEFGEGKGVRGKGFNPHYHVIFYLWKDDHSCVNDVLDCFTFQSLVQRYWQGHAKFKRNYLKGAAVCGSDVGRLNSPNAIRYVCKYVIKDIAIQDQFKKFKYLIYDKLFQKLTEKRWFEDWFYSELDDDKLFGEYTDLTDESNVFCLNNCIKDDPFVKERLDRAYRLFYRHLHRNVYSPKVFQSQGIGLSALDFVNEDCTIPIVDSKKVSTNVPLPLYLYRKKYCDVVKTADGTNKYILNSDGIQQRLNSLTDKLASVAYMAESVFEAYTDKSFSSKNISNAYSNLFSYVHSLDALNRQYFFELYGIYTLIYKDRVCDDIHRPIYYESDYLEFLQPDFYIVQQDQYSLYDLKSKPTYASHVEFQPYVRYFNYLDDLVIYHADAKDAQQLWEYFFSRQVSRQLNSLIYSD